jgi:hypothetical protein
MEPERTEDSSYLPATSPAWAQYYKDASQRRRLGKGQHRRIQHETKRRRRRENVIMVVSTVLVFVMTGGFYLLLSP